MAKKEYTFKEAFRLCLDGQAKRFRTASCPYCNGRKGVWLVAVKGECGWPDWALYEECGTALDFADFNEYSASVSRTWQVDSERPFSPATEGLLTG
jgi:hypothetical protein